MLEFARSLAEEAGKRLLDACGRIEERQIDFKGRRDMVTETDRRLEAFLTGRIADSFPEDAVLAEESIRRSGTTGRVWIVDPLDGTTNFVHGHPMFCVSIAMAEGYTRIPEPDLIASDEGVSGFFVPGNYPRLRLGVVSAPALGELYWAEKGAGAWLNGRRLRVSTEADLGRCLVATGFAYRRNEVANSNLGNFSRLALQVQGIRRGGSAALDLCFVAAGRFDAFWELYLKPWDVAAGIILVEEAAGRVTDFRGRQTAIEGVDILASNGAVHEQVRGLLEGPDPAWAAGERANL